MRSVKNITAGVALVLCVLICIYVMTLYLKFTPEEPKVLSDGTVEEVDSAIKQFLDENVNAEEHLKLVFLLALSAFVGFVFEKRPAFGMLTSVCALAYALTLFRFEGLPKFPMTVVSLCLVHVVGAIFFAATSERGEKSFLRMNSAAAGGLLCNAAALFSTISVARILKRLCDVADTVEYLGENGITVTTKLAIVPDTVEMLLRVFENHGIEKAREVLHTFHKQYSVQGVAEKIELGYESGEYKAYLILAVIIGIALVLSLILKKLPGLSALVSAIPAFYVFGCILYAKMTSATLAIFVLTLAAAIGSFAASQRNGMPALVDENGDELEIEDEDDPDEDELLKTDAEDGAENEDLPDWECDKLDYFYQKPKYDPEPEEITPEERDEYLEIEENDDGDQKEDTEQA